MKVVPPRHSTGLKGIMTFHLYYGCDPYPTDKQAQSYGPEATKKVGRIQVRAQV